MGNRSRAGSKENGQVVRPVRMRQRCVQQKGRRLKTIRPNASWGGSRRPLNSGRGLSPGSSAVLEEAGASR